MPCEKNKRGPDIDKLLLACLGITFAMDTLPDTNDVGHGVITATSKPSAPWYIFHSGSPHE